MARVADADVPSGFRNRTAAAARALSQKLSAFIARRRQQSATAPVRRRRSAPARSPRALNLALQGGGAHGAFTWGVLERLLEDGRIAFDGVSGTSAGAINAVLLAAGLTEAGPEGAVAKLESFWRGIAPNSYRRPASTLVRDAFEMLPESDWRVPRLLFDSLSRFLSPYQFNPSGYNPLRRQLEELVDFRRLRRSTALRLFIAATDVGSGQSRVFESADITVDMVLASACLPNVHQAVKVGARYYWDGGFTANPVLLPLVLDVTAEDTLLVQLIPLLDPELPTGAAEIGERLNQIVFNAPLRREIELIELGRDFAGRGLVIGNRFHRRFRRHRFHRIDATPYTRAQPPGSRMIPDWRMISRLRRDGRQAAEAWLNDHYDDLGRRASVDLAAVFA